MATYVTIGRNVTEEGPMSDAAWERFREEVEGFVSFHAGPIVTHAVGFGLWDGYREEAAVIVAKDEPWDVEAFFRDLSAIAEEFRQDAIAVTIGATTFAKARRK